MKRHPDAAGALKTIIELLFVLGLLAALFYILDGDVTAILEWAWNQFISLIDWVVDLISRNDLFRDFVAGP